MKKLKKKWSDKANKEFVIFLKPISSFHYLYGGEDKDPFCIKRDLQGILRNVDKYIISAHRHNKSRKISFLTNIACYIELKIYEKN